MKIFITGLAGMIGFHLAKHVSKLGWEVIGLDNFNDYYDTNLKRDREEILKTEFGIQVIDADIRKIHSYAKEIKDCDLVIHLAAYANPRHSLAEPQHYRDTNITGTQRVVELIEKLQLPIIYASSSCVMHGQPLPWSEEDVPSHQNNAYGWSKRVNECQFLNSTIAKTIGLRFFTVYGPYGRPDMALFLFADAIANGTEMTLYNNGFMKRDFTYVDDIVNGIECTINHLMDPSSGSTISEIYNIGYGQQVELLEFVSEIEKQFGRTTKKNFVPAHPADTPETWADINKIQKLGYKPNTPVSEGVRKFIDWYKNYYNKN